jgi:hypothetical protein
MGLVFVLCALTVGFFGGAIWYKGIGLGDLRIRETDDYKYGVLATSYNESEED